MSTWFPESSGGDGPSGPAGRPARSSDHPVGSRPGEQYAGDYSEERYPLASGDSFELPTRRPQSPAPGSMFEPAPPGSMFEPAPPGSMFEPAAREALSRQSPPVPAAQNQETQFLPPGGLSGADAGGYGDPGLPGADDPGYLSRQPDSPPATPSYDAAPIGGWRSGRGDAQQSPPPSARGKGSGPLVPPSGASRGDRPTPGFPDQQPGQGYPEPNRRAPEYAEPQYDSPQYDSPQYAEPPYAESQYAEPQYAEPQYGGKQYDSPPYAEPEQGGRPADPGRHPGRRPGQRSGPRDPQYDGGYPDQPYPDQPSASDAGSARSRGAEAPARGPGQPLSRVLAAAAWPVMAVGLFVSEAGSSAFGRIPAWSGFALVCLVLVGIGAFGGPQGPGSGRTWTLGVVGACGLAVFWVLLVLPAISRNTSFALTLGVALASAAVWLTPGRRRP